MAVEQPHFDDERTVQSARPVVPLEQIEAKVKQRRRWFLGSAFAVAMLLGAASALVSAYLKSRHHPEPEIQTLSVSSVAEVPAAAVLPAPEEQPSVTPVTPKRPAPRVRNTDLTNHPVERPRLSEEEELKRIRDAVLIDQWQERRQRRTERREERRERRRGDSSHPDSDRDLSDLNEIFEGRRRP